jgi:hypothetical protein
MKEATGRSERRFVWWAEWASGQVGGRVGGRVDGLIEKKWVNEMSDERK